MAKVRPTAEELHKMTLETVATLKVLSHNAVTSASSLALLTKPEIEPDVIEES